MLHLLLTAGLWLGAPVQDEPEGPPPPAPEVVEAAEEALETAFDDGQAPERIAAIEEHGGVHAPEVLRWLEKGLKDKDLGVKAAAVEALRWFPGDKALRALHKAYDKDKALREDEALCAAAITAIGQHASPSSIDVLLEDALAAVPAKVQVARIYALGHIRDKRSVEELLDLLMKTGRIRGPKGRGGATQPLMKEFATSLHVLTGEDFGNEEKAWQDWWKEHGKRFEVSEKPAGLEPKVARFWERYWSKAEEEAEGEEGDRRRRRRGGDDPGEEPKDGA